MTKAVAKKDEGALATAAMFEADAGAGFENADQESFALPILTILQSLSPQLDEGDGAYIEGAKAGMIINTATGEVCKEIDVIPCHFKRSYIHWAPRDSGGGYLGELEVSDPRVQEATRGEKGGALEFEDGTYLMDTRQHFVLVVAADGAYQPAVMSMSSTQIKKSKQWLTRMQNLKMQGANGLFTPPTFAKVYHFSTVQESNAQGRWHGWHIGEAADVTPELYEAAKAFKEQVAAGQAKAAKPEDVPF
jgi:hypothetical protein